MGFWLFCSFFLGQADGGVDTKRLSGRTRQGLPIGGGGVWIHCQGPQGDERRGWESWMVKSVPGRMMKKDPLFCF